MRDSKYFQHAGNVTVFPWRTVNGIEYVVQAEVRDFDQLTVYFKAFPIKFYEHRGVAGFNESLISSLPGSQTYRPFGRISAGQYANQFLLVFHCCKCNAEP